jgi:hypothetical protein
VNQKIRGGEGPKMNYRGQCRRSSILQISLIKLSATITSQPPAGTAKHRKIDFDFMWRLLTGIGKTL